MEPTTGLEPGTCGLQTAALPIELRRRDTQGHTADGPSAPGMIGAGRPDGSSAAGSGRAWLGVPDAPAPPLPAVQRPLLLVARRGGGHPRPWHPPLARPARHSGGRRSAVGRRRNRRPTLNAGAPGCSVPASVSTAGRPIPLGQRLEQQHGPGDCRIERADRASHRDAHQQVAASPHRRPERPDPRFRRRSPAVPAGRSGARSVAHPPRNRRCAGHGRGDRPTRPARSSTGLSRRCSTAPADALMAAALSGPRAGSGRRSHGRRRPRHCAGACRSSGDPRASRGRARTAARHLPRPGEDVVERRDSRGSTTRATPWCPSNPAIAVSEPPSTSTIGMRRRVACRTSLLESVAGAGARPADGEPPVPRRRLLDGTSPGDELLGEPEQVRAGGALDLPQRGVGGAGCQGRCPGGGPPGGSAARIGSADRTGGWADRIDSGDRTIDRRAAGRHGTAARPDR